MRIDELTAMVEAVCPIISLNSDGVVVFAPSATAAQKTAAQSVVTTNLPKLSEPPTLAQLQASACAAIDAQAGSTRLQYITDVAGQSETYLSKARDAEAYKAAGYPETSISSYPMVQAEAKALYGTTPSAAQYQSAADGIIATQAQWLVLAAAIEQQRRSGKIAVMAALTPAAAQSAQTVAVSALQLL